jgi:hypothetical protein
MGVTCIVFYLWMLNALQTTGRYDVSLGGRLELAARAWRTKWRAMPLTLVSPSATAGPRYSQGNERTETKDRPNPSAVWGRWHKSFSSRALGPPCSADSCVYRCVCAYGTYSSRRLQQLQQQDPARHRSPLDGSQYPVGPHSGVQTDAQPTTSGNRVESTARALKIFFHCMGLPLSRSFGARKNFCRGNKKNKLPRRKSQTQVQVQPCKRVSVSCH